MTKKELVDIVANKAELGKSEANEAVDAVFEAIKVAVKKGDKVALVGFGTFVAKNRKARMGINPKTMKKIKIAAKRAPTFKAGSEFKKFVAGK